MPYWVQLECKHKHGGSRTAAIQLDLDTVQTIRIERENDEIVDLELVINVGGSALVIGGFTPEQAKEAYQVICEFQNADEDKDILRKTTQKAASSIQVPEVAILPQREG